jgi:hypothetical protein
MRYRLFPIALLLVALQPDLSGTNDALADEPADEPIITFDLPAPASEARLPLVYANGDLSGVAPGSVAVQLGEKAVPIEIGFPEIRRIPLYSLELGRAELKESTVNVVVSGFKFQLPEKDNVFGAAILEPNERIKVAIKRERENAYEISLPPSPYWQILGFSKATQKYAVGNAALTIPIQEDFSVSRGVDHFGFDTSTRKVALLHELPTAKWSGGADLSGLAATMTHWIISSKPVGADIFTDKTRDLKDVSRTIFDGELQESDDFFVIVRKTGYVQGEFTLRRGKHFCLLGPDSTDTDRKLYCTLKKVPR